jgi:predicted nucleic acid-binding protein
MLIASHARASRLTLVTNNLDEFKRVGRLKLANWL